MKTESTVASNQPSTTTPTAPYTRTLPNEDPPLVCIYSPFGEGKTWLAVAGIPTGLFIAEPGAVQKVAWHGLGITPAIVGHPLAPPDMPILDHSIAWLQHWTANGTLAQYGGVIFDDASRRLSASIVAWRKEASKNQYHAFNRLADGLVSIGETLRRCGRPGVLLMHEEAPRYSGTTVISAGAPGVPSANQVAEIPSGCDHVLHLEDDPMSWDPFHKKCLMGYKGNPEWTGKDRSNRCCAALPTIPANLKEYLAWIGWPTPAYPGLEWTEEWSERITQEILKADPADRHRRSYDVAKWAIHALINTGVDERHAQYAVQNGIARAQLRARPSATLAALQEYAAPGVKHSSAPPVPGAPPAPPPGAPTAPPTK